jgi:hypothetical protein
MALFYNHSGRPLINRQLLRSHEFLFERPAQNKMGDLWSWLPPDATVRKSLMSKRQQVREIIHQREDFIIFTVGDTACDLHHYILSSGIGCQ